MALSVELHKKFKGFQMDVAFEHDGGSLGILGGSGMGKSMTLKMIAGLVKPDSGKVIVDGRIVYDSAAKIDMPARERHIGYLFQQYALFPTMTVTENIGIAMKKSGDAKKKEIDRLLEQFALQNLGGRMPNELSGGQRQRAFIAMVIAQDTEYVLLDEPTNNLDIYHATKLMRTVRRLCDELGKTVILVLHDINYASFYSDYICAFKYGKIAFYGSANDVITKENLKKVYNVDFEIIIKEGKPLSIYY